MGFAWNLILFSFMREREGYKHHADCTVCKSLLLSEYIEGCIYLMSRYTKTLTAFCMWWYTNDSNDSIGRTI